MPATPDFPASEMPYGRLATAVVSPLHFFGRVDLLLNDSSDDVI